MTTTQTAPTEAETRRLLARYRKARTLAHRGATEGERQAAREAQRRLMAKHAARWYGE